MTLREDFEALMGANYNHNQYAQMVYDAFEGHKEDRAEELFLMAVNHMLDLGISAEGILRAMKRTYDYLDAQLEEEKSNEVE